MKTTLSFKIGLALAMLIAISTTKVKAFTAVASGDWSNAATWGGVAPGGTVSNQDIIIPIGITVNLDMDIDFTGILNSFNVEGTLSTSSTDGITINQGTFSGDGTVDIESVTFTSLLASMTFTGDLTVNSFRNAGASLAVAAVVSISDTMYLESGSIALNAGANLSPLNNATIKVDAGSISISGGVFNSGNSYNVMYIGASKSSGVELNTLTLNNLTLHMDSNTDVLSTNNDIAVNGTLYADQGILDFGGQELTINGNVVIAGGAMLDSDQGSDLRVMGTTALTTGLSFAAGAEVNEFTVDNNALGSVKLLSGLDVNGSLELMDGSLALETGAALTMVAGSIVRVSDGKVWENGGNFVGTASYDVEYIGANNTSGVELTGSGLNNVSVSMASGSNKVIMGTNVAIGGELELEIGNWDLNGKDLTLNGTIDQYSSSNFIANANSELNLNLNATSNDTIYFDSFSLTLDKLTLDLPPASSVTLGSELIIATTLVLTNGKLDLGDHHLVLESPAEIQGYNDANYIVTSGTGHLQMNVIAGAPYVTFPIGTSSNYSPAMIQQTVSGTSGNFMVKANNGFLAQGTFGFDYATAGSVVDRTWHVSSASGVTVNMNMRVGWMAAAEVNGFDRNQAYISHYINGAWDSYAAGAASVGANSTFELSRMGVTTLSPFAVADTSLALSSLEEEVVASEEFHLYPNPVHHTLNIGFPDGSKSYQYEVLDLTGKTLISSSNRGTNNSLDVSGLGSGYYLLRATDPNDKLVATKRFVKN